MIIAKNLGVMKTIKSIKVSINKECLNSELSYRKNQLNAEIRKKNKNNIENIRRIIDNLEDISRERKKVKIKWNWIGREQVSRASLELATADEYCYSAIDFVEIEASEKMIVMDLKELRNVVALESDIEFGNRICGAERICAYDEISHKIEGAYSRIIDKVGDKETYMSDKVKCSSHREAVNLSMKQIETYIIAKNNLFGVVAMSNTAIHFKIEEGREKEFMSRLPKELLVEVTLGRKKIIKLNTKVEVY